MVREQQQAKGDRRYGERQHAPACSPGECCAVLRDPRTPDAVPYDSDEDEKRRRRQFDVVARGKADWIVRGQIGSV
jgi:hypothetical protein